jgi:hypothetical protein
MHDIAFGDDSLVAVESSEDPVVGNVDPSLADVGRGNRGTSRDGFLPEEIADRDASDVRHCGQGIEQGAASTCLRLSYIKPDCCNTSPTSRVSCSLICSSSVRS